MKRIPYHAAPRGGGRIRAAPTQRDRPCGGRRSQISIPRSTGWSEKWENLNPLIWPVANAENQWRLREPLGRGLACSSLPGCRGYDGFGVPRKLETPAWVGCGPTYCPRSTSSQVSQSPASADSRSGGPWSLVYHRGSFSSAMSAASSEVDEVLRGPTAAVESQRPTPTPPAPPPGTPAASAGRARYATPRRRRW